MKINFSWKVIIPNKPDTYPNEGALILIYTHSDGCYKNFYIVEVSKGNLIDYDTGEVLEFEILVFYRHLEELPTSIEVKRVKKCSSPYNYNGCGFDKNGRCVDKPDYINCLYCIEKEEYLAANH